MNLNTEMKNALSAEFVLGTLRGKARQRFQTMMMQSQALREQTWLWEQHLNEMGCQLKPIEPPSSAWLQIQQQLGFDEKSSFSITEPSTVNSSPSYWPTFSLLASAALLIIAILFVSHQSSTVLPRYSEIAIFNNAESEPVWLLEISENQIHVRATTSLQRRTDKDYQLWIVARDGRAPISLGLLPQDGAIQLAKHEIYEQLNIAALAVSIEPVGGSPNGLPTEVLYTTQPITL